MVQRKQNIAGFYDSFGRFRPIRTPSFVGTPKRKARVQDKKKYSRAKAGDLGKKRQALAREDVFDKSIRLQRESEEKEKRYQDKIEREIAGDTYGESGKTSKGQTLMQFVRAAGGIKPQRGKRGRAGELESLTFKQSGKRGLVSDKSRYGSDGMMQSVKESGYNVTDIDDMLDRLDDEARGGTPMYATHGYLDYRDNPGKKTNGVLIGDTMPNKTGFHLIQIGPFSYGVFLNKYLLKRFRLKATAQIHLNKLKAKVKANPASAATLAKAAIGVFDANSDGKVTRKDVRILRKTAAKLRPSAKKPIRSTAKNPNTITAAEFARLVAKTRRLASRKINGRLVKVNPVGYFAGVDSLENLKKLYRELAKQFHPDKPGGDLRKMQQLTSDYEKAHKMLLNNEGNAARADAERSAAVPLREAIEFAVTLPDNVSVVIRGLWLWIEGNTFACKDQIKSFKSSDGNRFKWASKKKAWFFAAVPSANRGAELSFDDIDRLHGRELVKERKQRLSINPPPYYIYNDHTERKLYFSTVSDAYDSQMIGTLRQTKDDKAIGYRTERYFDWFGKPRKVTKKNPIDPIMAFAAGASGILSALQIKAMVSKRKAKRGTTPAKSNPAGSSDAYTQTIFYADGRVRSVHVIDSRTGKPIAKCKTVVAAKTFATKNKIKLETNPKLEKNGIVSRYLGRRKAGKEYKKELKLTARLDRSRARRKIAETRAANPAKKANPKTTARRRTYEMFQGRPAENMVPMAVSSHAPARLDQLGDLIELKLNGGEVLNFTGKKFKLCAAGGKLWIAGGKFAKSNPAGAANVLNPIAEIEHVVYGTFKPHHGDNNYTHYIHKLGEESGHKPVLAVDREGFPVIRGGRYKIEARGIVN